MSFQTFEMERGQSTYEHDVSFNLSESGVEALTLGELMELADIDAAVLQEALRRCAAPMGPLYTSRSLGRLPVMFRG